MSRYIILILICLFIISCSCKTKEVVIYTNPYDNITISKIDLIRDKKIVFIGKDNNTLACLNQDNISILLYNYKEMQNYINYLINLLKAGGAKYYEE
jgi:hypothetical protein